MKIKYCFLVILLISLNLSLGLAQDSNKTSPKKKRVFDRYKISTSFIYGWGLESFKIAETTENTDVKMSAGGGLGGELCFGYVILPSFEVDLGLILQSSVYQEQKDRVVEGLKANFNRFIISCTPKITFPVTYNMNLKIGGGIDYYNSGKLNIKFTGVEHDIYKYDNITGFHLSSEIEIFTPNLGITKKSFVICGFKYYNINYNLKSCSYNGTDIPLDSLPVEIKRKVNKLNGSGFDIILGFAFYF